MPGEFEFLEWIRSQQKPTKIVTHPAGDDLAILKWPDDELLLALTFARDEALANPAGTIGIAVEDLSSRRDQAIALAEENGVGRAVNDISNARIGLTLIVRSDSVLAAGPSGGCGRRRAPARRSRRTAARPAPGAAHASRAAGWRGGASGGAPRLDDNGARSLPGPSQLCRPRKKDGPSAGHHS